MNRRLRSRSAAPFKFIAWVLLAASAGGISCSSKGAGAERRGGNSNAEDTTPPVAITVAKTESRNVPAYIQATGSLIADETSDVAPKVAGKVANVSANVGQFVSQGAVIAKIDESDARRNLAGAQARVAQAVAGVRQAEARLGLEPNGRFNASNIPEVRSAGANFEQAQAELRQAEANEKRYRELVETGDVSMIAYETFRTTRDTARSRANAARQALEAQVNVARQSNQAIRSAEANVEAARTEVGTAQQALADTVIRAPFSGFVSARPVAVGEFVSTASVIATILRSNPIRIQIQVAEADVPSVVVGRGVSVRVDAYPDRNFAGSVRAVNPAVDPASRSAIVEATIENPDNALRSGMFGTARITKEGGGIGIFVPKSAVYNDQSTQSYRAFVIIDGVAKLRVLQLGPEEGDSYQILDGLAADETVATSNLGELFEGARVVSGS
ncbi:MAG TPA: efflux RND transporter periplasmic adaptor subunit [Pyrinomonadaceae bacterium]|nr:efflux RND transporter periplasmic adaptor subunit [Pyrinomonadaceae bacterium]